MSTEQAKSGPGQYECEMCHGIFDFGWSNEEAKAEAEGKGLDVADCGIVCDDCYKKTPWGAVEANGLDVAAIHPSKGAKYSPNLHDLLTKRDKKHNMDEPGFL